MKTEPAPVKPADQDQMLPLEEVEFAFNRKKESPVKTGDWLAKQKSTHISSPQRE